MGDVDIRHDWDESQRARADMINRRHAALFDLGRVINQAAFGGQRVFFYGTGPLAGVAHYAARFFQSGGITGAGRRYAIGSMDSIRQLESLNHKGDVLIWLSLCPGRHGEVAQISHTRTQGVIVAAVCGQPEVSLEPLTDAQVMVPSRHQVVIVEVLFSLIHSLYKIVSESDASAAMATQTFRALPGSVKALPPTPAPMPSPISAQPFQGALDAAPTNTVETSRLPKMTPAPLPQGFPAPPPLPSAPQPPRAEQPALTRSERRSKRKSRDASGPLPKLKDDDSGEADLSPSKATKVWGRAAEMSASQFQDPLLRDSDEEAAARKKAKEDAKARARAKAKAKIKAQAEERIRKSQAMAAVKNTQRMKTVRFRCGACSAVIKVDRKFVGKRGQCPHCLVEFIIPEIKGPGFNSLGGQSREMKVISEPTTKKVSPSARLRKEKRAALAKKRAKKRARDKKSARRAARFEVSDARALFKFEDGWTDHPERIIDVSMSGVGIELSHADPEDFEVGDAVLLALDFPAFMKPLRVQSVLRRISEDKDQLELGFEFQDFKRDAEKKLKRLTENVALRGIRRS